MSLLWFLSFTCLLPTCLSNSIWLKNGFSLCSVQKSGDHLEFLPLSFSLHIQVAKMLCTSRPDPYICPLFFNFTLPPTDKAWGLYCHYSFYFHFLFYTYYQLSYQVCRTWNISKADNNYFPVNYVGFSKLISFCWFILFYPNGFSQGRREIYISNRFKYKVKLLDLLDCQDEASLGMTKWHNY